MKAFSTEAFTKHLHARTFSREDFLSQAVACGATEIEVGARFFTERAMYWTRMFRTEAEARGIKLSAIYCDSELATADRYALEAAQADISEWIRIAALSEIPVLKIRINGMGEGAARDVKGLAAALAPLAAMAERYGTMLTLADGNAGLCDNTLVSLAKALGYTAVRVAPKQPLAPADAKWAA